jgi:hypothetical protein
MTSAGPTELNWLNLSVANEIGLQVSELSDDGRILDRTGGRIRDDESKVSLKLPSGYRWIVVESRSDPSGIDAADWVARTGLHVSIVSIRSGYSAVVLGPFSEGDAELVMERLLVAGILPKDAY